ncbi:ABC transporter ATP-binding protein [Aeromicrobium sp. YIM 150415]|uniref:ABC transporter ATP-binding protein n=1 Tax=Aeromicrobium sp. YIM 150415 TaxID=2803912 RepID=UPI0019654C7F|nr:ABC transporter ATP-binding protein [Aeromicrobium sp. YIM 150415]MBM9463787.1 ABC transporter ATP-binding protein [Aeromicrobium sp. YIM 150415]
MREIRFLLPFLRTDAKRIALAIVCALLAAASLATLPLLTGRVVDLALAGESGAIVSAAAFAAAAVTCHVVAGWGAAMLLTGVASRLGHLLRRTYAERLARTSLCELEAHRTGDLLSRGSAEVEEVADFAASGLSSLIVTVVYLIVSLAALTTYSWQLTLLVVSLALPAAIIVMMRFQRRADEAFGAEAEALADLTATVVEGATVAVSLRGRESREWWSRRVAGLNRRLLDAVSRTVRALNTLPVLTALESLVLAALLLVGGVLTAAGLITAGTVTAFLVATGTLFASTSDLGDILGALQSARARVRRFIEVAGTSPDTGSTASPRDGALSLTDVTFEYAGRQALFESLHLDLPAGSRTALVGPSGAGKSTLAKILAGLYAPDRGVSTVGGVPAPCAVSSTGGRAIALVTQEHHLIPGTLRENLFLREDADPVAGVAALGLGSWVEAAGGLDAPLDPAGIGAVDRQLIGMIRAVLTRADVLILDEPTASLDLETDTRLLDALLRARPELTVVVVTHREAALDLFDVVLGVEGGHVTPRARSAGAPPPCEESS